MKKIILLTLFVVSLSLNNASAQESTVFIGVGTGFNANSGGLGVQLELPVASQLSFLGGVGIGSWGAKTSLSLNYHFNPSGIGGAIGVGFAHGSGLTETTPIDVTFKDDTESEVKFRLKPSSGINLMYHYTWQLGTKNKLVFTTGITAPLATDRFEVIDDTEGKELNNETKQKINALAPGGLIIGLTFMFGVN